MFLQALDRELTMDRSNDGLANLGLNSPVHDEQVSVVDARAEHGVSHSADKKSGRRMQNMVLIKVQTLVDEVVCRGGEPGLNPVQEQRQRLSLTLPWGDRAKDNEAVGVGCSCWGGSVREG